MRIIKAKYMLTMEDINPKHHSSLDKLCLLQDSYLCFNDKIVAIDDNLQNLQKQYRNVEIIDYGDKLVMPGLVNPHTHFEFCTNTSQLYYGNFASWLESVFSNRDELFKANNADYQALSNEMLRHGTTSIGAISSHGLDIQSLAQSKQRVVLFNETLGISKERAKESLKSLNKRLELCHSLENDRFKTAIAIHSLYAVDPYLLEKVIYLAHQNDYLLSTHLLESNDEKLWLEFSSGTFFTMFQKYFNIKESKNKLEHFYNHLNDLKVLLTHCCYAERKDFEQIAASNAHVVHCPISNMLLGNKSLDLKALDFYNISYSLASDGKSSNYGSSLIEEAKMALMLHINMDANDLANAFLKAMTATAAAALGLDCGMLKPNYYADFLVMDIPKLHYQNNLALQVLLNSEVHSVYVNGICEFTRN